MDKIKYVKLEQPDGSYSDSIPLAVDSDHVDVNGSTLTSELNNKANISNINNLQSQINGLASGSPLVASSVAGMTNTSKIYVNTTDGYWYYYNGSSWVIGGRYQSTGIANQSITYNTLNSELANSINYNTIDSLNINELFNIGGFNVNENSISYTNDNRRVRLKEGLFIYFTKNTTICLPNGKRAQIARKINNETYTCTNWVTDQYIIPSDGNYTIMIATDPDKVITQTIDNYIIGLKFINSQKTSINYTINGLTNLLNLDSLISYADMILGAYTTSGLNTNPRRISTRKLLHFDEDCILTIKTTDDIYVNVFAFFDENYHYVQNSNITWTNNELTITIDKNKYYGFTFRYEDDRNLTNIKYEMMKKIKIYGNKYVENKNNFNFPELVYHRGFSNLRPENTLPAFKLCKDYNCKWVETDVQLTSDNIPVIEHEQDLSVNTNGSGLINETTYSDFKNLYVRSTAYDGPYNQKLHFPSFDEFIMYCKTNGIYAQIELKETLTNDAVLYILNKVEELNMIDNVMFASFTLSFLQLIRQYNKNVKLSYVGVSYNINKLDGFLSLGKNSGLAIREDYLTTDIINLVHSAGGFVGVWVIDDLTELNKWLYSNVDYIATNKLLHNNNLSLPAINKFYSQSSDTIDYTIPYAERGIFGDVYQIETSIWYDDDTPPILTVGNLTYELSHRGEYEMINILCAPDNIVDIPFKLTGNNTHCVDTVIRHYKKTSL